MRHLIVSSALALVIGFATYNPADAASTKKTTASTKPPAASSQLTGSANCGTPDEPKPCPTVTRRPVQHAPTSAPTTKKS